MLYEEVGSRQYAVGKICKLFFANCKLDSSEKKIFVISSRITYN